MKFKIRISLFICLSLQITIQTIVAQNIKDSTYYKEIIKERQIKDSLCLTAHSPLEKTEISKFKGLKYFKIDPDYKVEGIFKKNKKSKPFKMKTSTDRLPVYFLYGTIEFALKGEQLILNVYQSKDLLHKPGLEDYLLIPFKDKTSGDETYGGGRFLDFRIPKNEKVTIDFNNAYNPYCAYSHRFSCPIPPKENTINIKILAGEKVFFE